MIMAAIARKDLVRFFCRNSYSVFESHFSFVLHFSTSRAKKQSVKAPLISDMLIHKYQFSRETVSRVYTMIKDPQKTDSVLSFLKENGFSSNQLEKIVRYYPQLFACSLEKTIKPKIKFFQDFGFSANDIAHVITRKPSLLHNSLNSRISPSLSVLKRVLGSNVEVAKILRRDIWFLSIDLDKILVPNIEFLNSCGIPMHHIIRVMCAFPGFLLQKPENMRKVVCKVDEMGVNRSSKMFIYAVRVLSTMSNGAWERKLKAFQNLGFSEDDTLRLFRSEPTVFNVSEDKIKKVKEVLLETGRYSMSCIIDTPSSLMYSVENRYIPRLQVLGVLEKRGLIKKWPGLPTVSKITDRIFFEKFVAPYNVGEVLLIPKNAVSGKRGHETSCSKRRGNY